MQELAILLIQVLRFCSSLGSFSNQNITHKKRSTRNSGEKRNWQSYRRPRACTQILQKSGDGGKIRGHTRANIGPRSYPPRRARSALPADPAQRAKCVGPGSASPAVFGSDEERSRHQGRRRLDVGEGAVLLGLPSRVWDQNDVRRFGG
jgi:hypothetical protein